METIFSYLAHRFVAQREDLATEGLNYLLNRSAAARMSLVRMLWAGDAAPPRDLRFSTQARGEDQARPDLIGEDDDGRAVLIGEIKFWAGLTEAQPVTYIRRLQAVGGGVLAVVAPRTRLRILWHELKARSEAAGISAEPVESQGDELLIARLDPGGHLVLTSWSRLLLALRSALEEAGETTLLNDLSQLEALAAQADEDAFLPLTSEELSGSTGMRVLQYIGLVRDAFADLSRMEGIDRAGQQWTDVAGDHGQYFLLHGIQARLMVNMGLWGRDGFTPIWLRVGSTRSDTTRTFRRIGRALEPLDADGGTVFPREKVHDIAIRLPMGVERDQVRAAIVEKVAEVVRLLVPVAEERAKEQGAAR